MKNSKHTPGPWNVKQVAASLPIISNAVDKEGNKLYIGHLFATEKDSDFNLSSDEIKANATLIAAAPEMLEALEMTIKELMRMYKMTQRLEMQDVNYGAALNESVMRHNEYVKAIVAKAKGES